MTYSEMRRNWILFALAVILACPLTAQNRKFIYAELRIVSGWDNNVKLAVDMGTRQEKYYSLSNNYIKDSDGNDMKFNTPMSAVNWLAKDGWELGDNCSSIDSSFIMKKDVSGMTENQVQEFLSRYRIGPAGSSTSESRGSKSMNKPMKKKQEM